MESTTTTAQPRSRQDSTRCEPMNPATPVIRAFMCAPRIRVPTSCSILDERHGATPLVGIGRIPVLRRARDVGLPEGVSPAASVPTTGRPAVATRQSARRSDDAHRPVTPSTARSAGAGDRASASRSDRDRARSCGGHGRRAARRRPGRDRRQPVERRDDAVRPDNGSPRPCRGTRVGVCAREERTPLL